ncbi:MAG: acyl-CoA thioesterase, partial [Alphaproteobacteria bacterium]|nr:acyl-CoA thioesterase [Alphaproteobacteria bacterium]
ARWTPRLVAASSIAAALLLAPAAQAETTRIVAIGSSQTAGQGVAAAAAWPVQLQALLRKKGYDAEVINAGVDGDDSGLMLARFAAAVPDGTKLVIIQVPSTIDQQKGIDTKANVAAMMNSLEKRKIKTILEKNIVFLAGGKLQPDKKNPNEAGHAAIAAKFLPQVVAAIHKRSGTKHP